MKKITIHPLKGIAIENDERIEFGTSKSSLISSLGKPSDHYENKLFYDELELRIDLDEEQRIEFIEFICGPFPEETEIELYGINPFGTENKRLIEILSQQNNGQIDDSEAPYCYAFHEISVGVFRDSCEDDINEMIVEMKANGEYAGNENRILAEMQKAKFFWTLGIGKEGYYN